METIIYQGQPVQATLVNYLSGNIPTSTVEHDGDEELFRDEAGRYYLRRTLNLLDSESDDPQPASGRTHVHRININAAILWATTRLNSDTLALRCDAASLLMEGRGYRDPHPVHLNASKRNGQPADAGELVCQVDGPVSGATGDGWFDGCIRPEAGSGARVRTIYDLDPLHAALLKRFTERHGINVAVLVRACLVAELESLYDGHDRDEEPEAVACLRKYGRLTAPPSPREIARLTAAAGCDGTVTPPPPKAADDLPVRLDSKATALVRRYLDVTPWDYTAEDIVSGAIANVLQIAFNDLEDARDHFLSSRDGDFADDGWGYVEQEIYDACQRRTGGLEYDDQEADGCDIPRTPKPGHPYPSNPARRIAAGRQREGGSVKNRVLPAGAPAKKPKPPKGRYARVWLSPEFVAWCQRSAVVPREIASSVLHTWGLSHPGRTDLTIVSTDPTAAERIFAKRKGAA